MDYQSLERLLASIHSALSPTGNSPVAGAVDSAASSNPLYMMMMQAGQPDIMNHRPASPLPASPTPQVANGGPLSPVAPRVGSFGANPPSPPISGPQTPPAPPQDGASTIPWWANATGADFGGSSAPMPRPRPQMAQAPQAGGPIPGAVGPTSTGGAPLQAPPQAPQAASGYSNWNGMQFGPDGNPITPQQPNGSDLIQKMLSYLNTKANNQNPQGS